MKKCSTCLKKKDLSQFNRNKSKKDGYEHVCKDCKKQYQKDWYDSNKKCEQAKIKLRKENIKEWFVQYKSTKKCSHCPESHPACIQFHHLDSSKKEIEIGSAVHNGWSIERILKELAKCIPLCANCHFKLHFIENKVEAK